MDRVMQATKQWACAQRQQSTYAQRQLRWPESRFSTLTTASSLEGCFTIVIHSDAEVDGELATVAREKRDRRTRLRSRETRTRGRTTAYDGAQREANVVHVHTYPKNSIEHRPSQ